MLIIKIIAEIANVHEGSLNYAIRLIEEIASSGCDAIKVQLVYPEELYLPSHPSFKEFEILSLGDDGYEQVAANVRNSGKKLLADVFGHRSLTVATAIGADGVKIHASDLLDLDLIGAAAIAFSNIFLSCGGLLLPEIAAAVRLVKKYGRNPVLVSGIQRYPTLPEDCNLGRIAELKRLFGTEICVAEHLDADSKLAGLAPLVAMGLGASFIEKHVTLDRKRRMDDDHSAFEPQELTDFINDIRSIERVIGNRSDYSFNAADKNYRAKIVKRPVLNISKSIGQRIQRDEVKLIRIDGAAATTSLDSFIGSTVRRPLASGDLLSLSDLDQHIVTLITVRSESRRFPAKWRADVGGKCALAFLAGRLTGSLRRPLTVCTTKNSTDDAVEEFCQNHGFSVYRGADENILARLLGAANKLQANHIIRATGDNLFIDPQLADKAVEAHLLANADYTRTVGLPDGADFEIIAIKALKVLDCILEDQSKTEYLSWFLDRPELFNILDFAPLDRSLQHVRLTLDYPEDLGPIRSAVAALPYNFNTLELINYIEKNTLMVDLTIADLAAARATSIKQNISFAYRFET